MTDYTVSPAQDRIFRNEGFVYNAQGEILYPIYGMGQHRSARSVEKRGFGRVVTSSMHYRHQANAFFKFEDGYFFNHVTGQIDRH